MRRLCLATAAGVTAAVLAVQAAISLSASHLAPAGRPGHPAEAAAFTLGQRGPRPDPLGLLPSQP